MRFQTIALASVLVFTLFLLVDFRLTWMTSTGIRELYYYNKRDLYFILLFVTPAFVSHIITIWGHYYKADVLFQKSIAKVSTAAPKKRKGISKWDKHDPWLGYTGRYWALVALAFVLNLMWFIQPIAVYLPGGVKFLGLYGAITGKIDGIFTSFERLLF
ncbi:hypothetical protein BCR41DRAFT_38417 [Lobosporangium transversale]|uniref:Uncharacterized protein n=1 Tax=Lobosporangium transversale TaxID=64571 RepID=A0A1Y2GRJ8_9FUNG|nr:hypothetical protein BCR41DRAFT_38417 [Lobosporangium transversale]ORZ19093.1 hypothetical protein BCR41DRAFT_38417 [Lobosporangium transversale]|eukprot:XP_021882261.1 hypothetical protein BCR41DRAFT_38417 [Lobosporangium transversale]